MDGGPMVPVARPDNRGMYVPAHFKPSDDEVRELLRHHGAADLVTATADGLLATMLPLIWVEPDAGAGDGRVGRPARSCRAQQPAVEGAGRWRGLVIVRGPDAYISPAWYATKREHGRVVPTWNYMTAHVHGRLVIHDDPAWVEANVRALSAKHEASRAAAVVRRRRPGAVHRGPAEGDRRHRTRHRSRRGQVEAEPEPLGRGHRRHDRWARGIRRGPRLGRHARR